MFSSWSSQCQDINFNRHWFRPIVIGDDDRHSSIWKINIPFYVQGTMRKYGNFFWISLNGIRSVLVLLDMYSQSTNISDKQIWETLYYQPTAFNLEARALDLNKLISSGVKGGWKNILLACLKSDDYCCHYIHWILSLLSSSLFCSVWNFVSCFWSERWHACYFRTIRYQKYLLLLFYRPLCLLIIICYKQLILVRNATIKR